DFVASQCLSELGNAKVDVAGEVLSGFVDGGKCVRSTFMYLGGRIVMHLRLGGRADAATDIVEEDNELLTLDGIHGHHRDISCRDRGRSLLLCVDSLPTQRRIGPVGDVRGGGSWR